MRVIEDPCGYNELWRVSRCVTRGFPTIGKRYVQSTERPTRVSNAHGRLSDMVSLDAGMMGTGTKTRSRPPVPGSFVRGSEGSPAQRAVTVKFDPGRIRVWPIGAENHTCIEYKTNSRLSDGSLESVGCYKVVCIDTENLLSPANVSLCLYRLMRPFGRASAEFGHYGSLP